jgi:anti-sigma B factor antagonist
MQIAVRTSSSYTILKLDGRLVLGMDLEDLRNAVHNVSGEHPKKIILNLANVTYVDSCGIGELINTFKHVKNRGGHLILTNLPRKIKILLDTAQLTKVFEVSESDQAAIINPRQKMPQHQMCC